MLARLERWLRGRGPLPRGDATATEEGPSREGTTAEKAPDFSSRPGLPPTLRAAPSSGETASALAELRELATGYETVEGD